MDVKKVIFILLGVVIAVGLAILIVNVVFGTDFITGIFNAVIGYINEFWSKISGSDKDLINEISQTAQRETVAW